MTNFILAFLIGIVVAVIFIIVVYKALFSRKKAVLPNTSVVNQSKESLKISQNIKKSIHSPVSSINTSAALPLEEDLKISSKLGKLTYLLKSKKIFKSVLIIYIFLLILRFFGMNAGNSIGADRSNTYFLSFFYGLINIKGASVFLLYIRIVLMQLVYAVPFYLATYLIYKNVRNENATHKINKFFVFSWGRLAIMYFFYFYFVFYVEIPFCVFSCDKLPGFFPFILLSPLLYLLSCVVFIYLRILHEEKRNIFYKVIPVIVFLFFVCPIYTGTIPISSGESSHGDLVFKVPGNYGNDTEKAICVGYKSSLNKYRGSYRCYGWKFSAYNPFIKL